MLDKPVNPCLEIETEYWTLYPRRSAAEMAASITNNPSVPMQALDSVVNQARTALSNSMGSALPGQFLRSMGFSGTSGPIRPPDWIDRPVGMRPAATVSDLEELIQANLPAGVGYVLALQNLLERARGGPR